VLVTKSLLAKVEREAAAQDVARKAGDFVSSPPPEFAMTLSPPLNAPHPRPH